LPRAARGAGGADVQGLLRALPSVDVLIGALAGESVLAGVPRPRLAAAVREALGAERRRLLEAGGPAADAAALGARIVAALTRSGVFSLAPVINATGVVLHTNLGRALLSPLAQERLREVAGSYSNLEMDVARKERGSRLIQQRFSESPRFWARCSCRGLPIEWAAVPRSDFFMS